MLGQHPSRPRNADLLKVDHVSRGPAPVGAVDQMQGRLCALGAALRGEPRWKLGRHSVCACQVRRCNTSATLVWPCAVQIAFLMLQTSHDASKVLTANLIKCKFHVLSVQLRQLGNLLWRSGRTLRVWVLGMYAECTESR